MRAEGVYVKSLSPTQFCCEPKSSLKSIKISNIYNYNKVK